MSANSRDLYDLAKETVKWFVDQPENWMLPFPPKKVLTNWCKHFNCDAEDAKPIWLHMSLCFRLRPSLLKPLDKPFKEWACKEYGI